MILGLKIKKKFQIFDIFFFFMYFYSGTKEFEIYVDKNYHGTDDSKYNLFASGTMPQCDDANTCTDTLHVIKAPSRITRYLYFKVTATYEDVGGLTYFAANPNPKDDSDLCQTQF